MIFVASGFVGCSIRICVRQKSEVDSYDRVLGRVKYIHQSFDTKRIDSLYILHVILPLFLFFHRLKV